MYFTSGSSRAFESLMQGKPSFDHYDSGSAGVHENCGACRFYRPHWKYSLKGLTLINREQIDAIREAVRELERAGYIVRSRKRDSKGPARERNGTKKSDSAKKVFEIYGDIIKENIFSIRV